MKSYPLRLFDKRTQGLVEIDGRHRDRRPVRIMLCGPTVYEHLHVGHARMLLTYDLVSRFLRLGSCTVEMLVNVTDIDAKIFEKASREGVPPSELATRYINEMLQDIALVGISAFSFARVSDYAGIAMNLVKALESADGAYFSAGNVYLKSGPDRAWGSISHMSRTDIDDCRLDISELKLSVSDILVWNAGEDCPTIGFSDSDLGSGIPWWHMQDTSVAVANYPRGYDVHGGAGELAYPHHESHRSQMASLIDMTNPVRCWTYVGIVTGRGGVKMSKSLGNSIKLRDAVAASSANALRLFSFNSHYTTQVKFSLDRLHEFEEWSQRIHSQFLRLARKSSNDRCQEELMAQFLEKISDDLDTPAALEIFNEALLLEDASAFKMAALLGLRY